MGKKLLRNKHLVLLDLLNQLTATKNVHVLLTNTDEAVCNL